MIIQICGSWRPKPGSQLYETAYQLGKAATEAGHTILTGGYSGVMEAASRGAVEARGQPIGVTCPELDAMLKPNKWVRELRKAESLPSRLCTCIEIADAAIFLPGRSGTACELSLAAEMRSKGLLAVPLILFGRFWAGYFEWLDRVAGSLEMPADERQPLSHVIVSSVGEAVALLDRSLN